MQKYQLIWDTFKDLDAGKMQQGSEGNIDAGVIDALPKLNGAEILQCFSLLSKIARNCEYQEFEKFVDEGNVPAVKLENEELALVSGGKASMNEILNAINDLNGDFFK